MSLRSLATIGILSCLLIAVAQVVPASDRHPPRIITVSLTPPAEWTTPPPPPPLSAAQERNVELWMVHLGKTKNVPVLSNLVKVDALLNEPANAGLVRNANEAREIISAANRALRYERGEISPLSRQLLDEFKARMPNGFPPKQMRLLAGKAFAFSAEQVLGRLEKAYPGLKNYLKEGDRIAGLNKARAHYEIYDARALRFLDDAYRRARPYSASASPAALPDHAALWRAAARMRAAESGSIAAALMAAEDSPLQPVPMKSEKELRTDPRYAESIRALEAARQATGKPASAMNPYVPYPRTKVSGGAGPSAAERPDVAPLLREYRRFRHALAKNTAALLELRKQVPEGPSELEKHYSRQQTLHRERQELIQDFQRCASVTLACLAHLGVDPKTIQDLTAITNAGIGVATGINMIVGAANAWNPVGWMTILGGLTNLFSTGPDTQQQMLEMMAGIRQDLAELRYEMRLTQALIREENRLYAEKLLSRTADMEYNLSQQIGVVGEQARWNEYRLLQIEGQIQSMRREILRGLAEIYQKDVVKQIVSHDLNPDTFKELATNKGSELVRVRYEDALTTFYTAAVHGAASETLAGRGFRSPAPYGISEARLSTGGPRALLPLVQDEDSAWARVNDLIELGKAAGIDPLAKRVSSDESASSDLTVPQSKPLLPLDRSRLVNPAAWSLAAEAFLRVAEKGGPYFLAQPNYRRAFAKIYLRGEDFNDAMGAIAVARKYGVFGPLLDTQLKAIGELEEELSSGASLVSQHLANRQLDAWAGYRQPIPKGIAIGYDGPTLTWQQDIHNEGFQPGDVTAIDLSIDPKDCARLIDEGQVAKPFAMASVISPVEGRGGRQDFFGGSLHLKVTNINFPKEYIRFEGSRRESTGLFGWGPGKYHPFILYGGPAFVTFEVHYITKHTTKPHVVFRKRVPTREHARFYKEQDAEKKDVPPRFVSWNTAEEYEKLVDAHITGRSITLEEALNIAATGKNSFTAAEFIKSQWPGLREDLFRKGVGWMDEKLGPPTASQVEKAITDRLNFEVAEFEKDKDEAVAAGLQKPGELIREIIGCQVLMLRYVQLALPESVRDQELMALLVGDQAAWGGSAVTERFHLAGKEPKPLVQKMGDRYEVPLTKTMRAQTLALQMKLAEVIDRRRAADGPDEVVRHPMVEGMLLRYALTARAMGIDLEKELKAVGVTVPGHWVCRRLDHYAKAFSEGQE